MRLRNNKTQTQLISLFVMAAMTLITLNAKAAKQETAKIREASVYIIKDGDYLGGIAMAHGISVSDLIEANGLDNPDKIYSGMELIIPGAVVKGDVERVPKKEKQKKIIVEIPKGFTLSRVAKVYGVSVNKIFRANKSLSNPDNIQAGMKILIPGATEEIELVPPPPCFSPAVEFYRIRNNETEMIHLTYCNGKPNPAGIEKLSQFSSPLNIKKMPFPLHSRLAVLLQKVANEYPGRRIEIVSGQRTKKDSNHESFHTKGQAIDFRVAGVPNRTLVNFVRKFDNTGVGFYPNSVFVHMDTRKRNAFWIDYSRPGERAIYAKAGTSKEEIEKIRAARSAKKAVKNKKHPALTTAVTVANNETPKTSDTVSETLNHAAATTTDTNTTQASEKTESSLPQKHADELAAVTSPGQA